VQSQAELHLSRREKNGGEEQEIIFFARTASSLLPKVKQKTKMRRVASLISSLRRRKLHVSHHFSLEWRIHACDEERDVTVSFSEDAFAAAAASAAALLTPAGGCSSNSSNSINSSENNCSSSNCYSRDSSISSGIKASRSS
jgi:hypothetical protein